MNKLIVKVDKNDPYRALLTDTAPFDIPILLSNDGFYQRYKLMLEEPKTKETQVAHEIFKTKGHSPTLPFVYKINKSSGGIRAISLVHPRSQIDYVNFYKRYDGLICHYSSRSPFTIRAPKSVGNKFYVDKNFDRLSKYKSDSIDLLKEDISRKFSKSYFSYHGYRRVFGFIDSKEHLNLERKFKNLLFMDISKCFDTIYTHTLSWSVKNLHFSKSNKGSSFPNDFDKTISLSNYGETNGIPIGSEFSRVFAEVLLQGVDENVLDRLKKEDIIYGKHYSIRRYVDDFFIYSLSSEIEAQVLEVVLDELSKYKLYINENKTESFKRPFFTKRSSATLETSKKINEFFSEIIEENSKDNGLKVYFPRKGSVSIRKSRTFITELKNICVSQGVGYEAVSSYTLSAIFSRIVQIIESYSSREEKTTSNDYKKLFLLLIDVTFHLYSVCPEVSNSYTAAKIIILTTRFFDKDLPNESGSVKQAIFEKGSSFLKGGHIFESRYLENHVSLEKLNIFVAMSELGQDYLFPEDFIMDMFLHRISYFEVISVLYYIAENSGYERIRSIINHAITSMLEKKSLILTDSKRAHLFLDTLSCPYIDENFKLDILRSFRKEYSLSTLKPAEANKELAYFSSSGWFVGWRNIDLLSSIEKKQLRSSY